MKLYADPERHRLIREMGCMVRSRHYLEETFPYLAFIRVNRLRGSERAAVAYLRHR